MAERDRAAIEELVRRVLLEKLGGNGPRVKKVEVPRLDVAAEHRMDTGNPADRVWTRDLFTLEEAPRLGCGLMVMERTTFPWTCLLYTSSSGRAWRTTSGASSPASAWGATPATPTT